ncbi:MAG TPA: hypothetical protein VJ698_03115 [Noviherbaspirillum sp.]|uniref:hypothetical protein n=1 Tax=Noviherbaspirillum sp. TaxID=1926288 RepID=UPI002B49A2A2|nr:hypothetical protein [Noviherbaspirillum sp.]HJV84441.1 hypothetical protein [Noviherbaspirillum sp.]
MRNLCLFLLVSPLFAGCMINAEGARVSPPPPAIQGSNDAQGNPLSVPGAGMGVGSGNPNPVGPGGMGPVPPR